MSFIPENELCSPDTPFQCPECGVVMLYVPCFTDKTQIWRQCPECGELYRVRLVPAELIPPSEVQP